MRRTAIFGGYDPARFRGLWTGLAARERLFSHFNSRLYPMVRLMRTAARGVGKSAGRGGTDLWMPPGIVNRFLERVFAGELVTLLDLLRGRRREGYRVGVSLIAVLVAQAPSPVRSLPTAGGGCATPLRTDV